VYLLLLILFDSYLESQYIAYREVLAKSSAKSEKKNNTESKFNPNTHYDDITGAASGNVMGYSTTIQATPPSIASNFDPISNIPQIMPNLVQNNTSNSQGNLSSVTNSFPQTSKDMSSFETHLSPAINMMDSHRMCTESIAIETNLAISILFHEVIYH
jgi:hypothetical protein